MELSTECSALLQNISKFNFIVYSTLYLSACSYSAAWVILTTITSQISALAANIKPIQESQLKNSYKILANKLTDIAADVAYMIYRTTHKYPDNLEKIMFYVINDCKFIFHH